MTTSSTVEVVSAEIVLFLEYLTLSGKTSKARIFIRIVYFKVTMFMSLKHCTVSQDHRCMEFVAQTG